MVIGYIGAEALSVLLDDAFKLKWDELFKKCYWATAYQDRKYVSLWYELYNKDFTPLLIVEEDGDSTIGIFPLAITGNGEVVGAGYPQSEYHSWISDEESQKKFFKNAVHWIQGNLKGKSIHLKYLPHLISFDELQNDKFLKQISFWKAYSQPFMKINEETLTQEIKKKNRKEKINRLKRLGEFKFEKLEKAEDFDAILDHLIVMAEFRKGAMYGNEFYSQDKNKRDFTLRLFKEGLLHVTVLKIDEEIIGANAGVQGKTVVHLQGISAYSPFHAKYSPGILCFLMLGLQMHKEGFLEFDLTPGGTEGYKSDLASDFHTTYELIITSRQRKLKIQAISTIKDFIKSNLLPKDNRFFKMNNLGLVKDEVKRVTLSLLKEGPMKYFDKKNSLREPVKNFRIFYLYRPARVHDLNRSVTVSKNRLKDLLLFSEKDAVITKKNFLFEAMRRLEYGHQVYSLVKEEKLLGSLWYIPKDAKVDHPPQSKADFPTIFLATYQKMEPMEVKDFFTHSVLEIFRTNPDLDILNFKTMRDNMDDLINQDLFEGAIK